MHVRERGGVAGSSGGAGEDLQAVVAVRDGVHEAAAAAPGLERQDPGVVEADRPHGEALGLVVLARAVGVEAVAEPGEVGRELLGEGGQDVVVGAGEDAAVAGLGGADDVRVHAVEGVGQVLVEAGREVLGGEGGVFEVEGVAVHVWSIYDPHADHTSASRLSAAETCR